MVYKLTAPSTGLYSVTVWMQQWEALASSGLGEAPMVYAALDCGDIDGSFLGVVCGPEPEELTLMLGAGQSVFLFVDGDSCWSWYGLRITGP